MTAAPEAPKPSLGGAAVRLALLAFFTWEAARQLRSHDFEFSVFGGVIFGVHELGHLVFAPLGEFLTVAGGSIAQVALPIAVMALFHKQKNRYAVAVIGCWLAVSLGQLGIYVADARAESLDLVSFSPEGGVHDWNYLLERMHLLNSDVALGHLVKFVGWIALGLSVLLGLSETRRIAGYAKER
ncbi:MAG: hypothetical protein ACHQU8_03960 [Gemmatimonadales bacterium]